MNASSKKFYQIAAYILTGLCLCSTAVLVLTFMFGPNEGMEAMVILIPWCLAGLMHIFLGIAAIICVFLTGSFLKNAWILVYFLLFFSINAYTIAVMSQADKAIARKLHTITQPEAAEIYEVLRTMKVGAGGHYQINSAASKRVYELVNSGVDLSYISPGYDRSIIMMATLSGDPDLVALMLAKGAHVEGRDPASQYSPLAAAVRQGLRPVVKILLEHGADPNDPKYTGYPPLVVAAREGDAAVTRLLLEAGADPDKKTSSSSPALVLAAGKGHVAVVKLLLEHGADPNIGAFGGATPLVGALKSNCAVCARLLLEAGADGSGKAARNETPLAIALKNNDREMIELLAHKAGPQLGSSSDLSYALAQGDIALFEAMLQFGVDPDSRDERGNTLLITVATKSKYRQRQQETAPEVTRLLLEHRANPDLTTTNNMTALFRAANTGNGEVAKILIDSGADINIATENDQTPLHTAIQKKNNDIALALLAAGADPNKQANWGSSKSSPLGTAARNNNPEMIMALFEAGAVLEPGSRDLCDLVNYGAQHPEVLRMIAETGVDLNQPDQLKRYPLDIVVKNGNPESIQFLLERGVSPVLPDFKGLQPFMHFVRNGQAGLVAASLENSAELRENQKLMRDGMYWAVRAAHPEVVKVMLEYNHRFRRIEEVEALLKWAKSPPATEADKQEIMRLFSAFF